MNQLYFIKNVIILKIHQYYINQKGTEDSEDFLQNVGNQKEKELQIKIVFCFHKKKIYLPKNNIYYEIPSRLFIGRSFCIGDKYCVQVTTNAYKNIILQTNEKDFKEFFDGDENALSEDGNFKGVNAEECEVFQIIF